MTGSVKNRFKSVAFAVATLIAGAGNASASELFFNFNNNSLNTPDSSLFLFGTAGTNIAVSNGVGFSQSVTLGASGFYNMALPLSTMTSGTGISDKGFVVSSSSNIGAYFVNRATHTSDMAYLFDKGSLGTQYIVASQGGGFGEGSQIGVTATADGTTVTVTPKVGASVSVNLNKGQTYTYAGGAVNLTGSTVSANKPVAVLSGHECAQVPSGVAFCDNLVEQMPSIDRLSKNYVVAKTPKTGSAGNLVRVVSPTDNNTILLNGAQVSVLQAGDFYEFTLQDAAEISASSGVLVAQYLKGQDATNPDVSDPSLAVLGGKDTWLKSYKLATPTGNQAFDFNYANIVIESAALSSLMLNGLAVDTSSFADVTGTTLKYGNVAVNGLFTMTADDKFQLLLAGFADYDTYLTTGGTSFAVGVSQPIPEPATAALVLGGLLTLSFARARRA